MSDERRRPLDRLVRPDSVAIIGASADPRKLGGRPLAFLRKHGFAGRIYPVNPGVTHIGDLTCYPDVASLPEIPDVGLILVGRDRVAAAVSQLSDRGADAAIVLAGGFAESGEEGKWRQEELTAAAGDVRLLGPNTIGLFNVSDRTMLSPSGSLECDEIPRGSIALVSQSGGVAGSILSRAGARGLGFSKLVATGNESDLEVSDFIEYLADDPDTSVIALYLEGLKRVDRFRDAVTRAIDRSTPVVVFKVGRSEAGARSAASHTGAMAGSDRSYDALFRQVGAIRVDRFSDLLDVPTLLATGRKLRGDRIGILTSTGGAGVMIADACGVAGFRTPDPSPETIDRLRLVLPADSAVHDRNPIDLTLAGLRDEVFRGATTALLEGPDHDALVVVVGSSGLTAPSLVSTPVIELSRTTDKPLIVYVSPEAPEIRRALNLHGVPTFDAPEACASALRGLLTASQWRPAALPDARGTVPGEPEPSTVQLPRGRLNEAASKALFSAFGLPTVEGLTVNSPRGAARAAATLGGTVVLKILANEVTHKSDIGGVVVGVEPADVELAAATLLDRVRARAPDLEIEGLLVERHVSGAVELILGATRDAAVGWGMLVGAGGTAAEVFEDIAIRLIPIDRNAANDMLAELRISRLLRGFRGSPAHDVDALVTCIVRFSEMIDRLDNRLIEAEINPLLVLPAGEGVVAVDGLVVLEDRERVRG